MFAGCWQAGKVDLLVEEAGDEAGPAFLSCRGLCTVSRRTVEALGALSLPLTGPVFSYVA